MSGKCAQALEKIPALALGDLDVEERRAVEVHLAQCGKCREEADRQADAVKRLAAMPGPDPSAARRDRAAGAMMAEREALVSRLVEPRRRAWIRPAVLAASVAVAVLGTWAAMSWRPGAAVLQVERLTGSARVIRAGSHESIALQPGDVVRRGDLVTSDGVTWLTGPGKSRIALNRESTVKFEDDHGPLLMLVQGSLYGEVQSVRHTVVDATNRRLVAKDCAFEATLTRVAGYVRGPGREATVAEHAAALAERLKIRVTCDDEVKHRRVTFGEGGIEEFSQAMAGQGLDVVRRTDGSCHVAAGRLAEGGTSLFVKLSRGEARVEGPRGSLVLSAGQAGEVTSAGDVEKADGSGPVAPWRK